MSFTKKLSLVLFVLVLTLTSVPSITFASGAIRVTVDGHLINFPDQD